MGKPEEGDISKVHRPYELTFILPPALPDTEIEVVQGTIQGWITDSGGEISKATHWGRRKLAYPIQNYKEGYYILLEFNADSLAIKDLDRRLRLEGSVLRHLIVKDEE